MLTQRKQQDHQAHQRGCCERHKTGDHLHTYSCSHQQYKSMVDDYDDNDVDDVEVTVKDSQEEVQKYELCGVLYGRWLSLYASN